MPQPMLERAALLLAVAASVCYFAYVLARRLRGLSWAREGLPFDRLGERFGRLFGEVLLQRRVIAERPLAGILHALVMWGFLAFGLVSIMSHNKVGVTESRNGSRFVAESFQHLW